MTLRTFGNLFAMLALTTAAAISQAADPGNVTVDTGGITYSAQSGDTLISIAQRFTTRSGNWLALGKINRIDKDSSIPVGTPIAIPADLLMDEPVEAGVVAFSGNVQLRGADGAAIRTVVGARLAQGAQIETGANSFLTLGLADESRISVPSNSSVKLTKLRKTLYTGSPRTELGLVRGRVESRVSPLTARRGSFEVRTTRSVAGVRGTHFRVRLNGDKIGTEVLGGRVAVGSPEAPYALVLDIAKGNIIGPRTMSAAIDLLPPPRLAGAPSWQKANGARFEVTPVAGAVSYHLDLARDAQVLDVLAETSGGARGLRVDDLPEGDYFVRLSAIDANGLEGMPRTEAVTLKAGAGGATRTAPAQGSPSATRSDQRELVLRWPGQADRKYALQVARDVDFTWLLFTGIVDGTEARLPRPPFGTYYARVQSLNPDGSRNPFSLTQALLATDQWIINDGDPVAATERPAPTR